MSLLTISSSCRKEDAVFLESDLTSGRLVKQEVTIDVTGQNPRSRWIIDLAPLSLAGYQGTLYSQAKVFTLPSNTTCQVGQTVSFHYQIVPYDQQTAWRIGYEWRAVPATPPAATALPKITLSDVSN